MFSGEDSQQQQKDRSPDARRKAGAQSVRCAWEKVGLSWPRTSCPWQKPPRLCDVTETHSLEEQQNAAKNWVAVPRQPGLAGRLWQRAQEPGMRVAWGGLPWPRGDSLVTRPYVLVGVTFPFPVTCAKSATCHVFHCPIPSDKVI